MALLSEFDIKTVCRICLDCPEEVISLWEYEKYEGTLTKQLAEMLMECTPIKVEKDGILSEIICLDCLPILISMYTFRKRCIDTNSYLDNLALGLHLKLETNLKLEPKSSEYENLNDDDCKTEVNSEYWIESEEDVMDQVDGNNHPPDDMIVGIVHEIETPIEVESLKKSTNVPHKCEHCNKRFTTKRMLNRHSLYCIKKVNIQTTSDELLVDIPRFPCDICHIDLDTKLQLTEHFTAHVAVALYFDYKQKDNLYFCYACGVKELIDEIDLHTHLNVHSTFTCNTCKESFNSNILLKKHLQTHGVFNHICQICLISFQYVEEVTAHIQNHRNDNFKSLYHCALCDFKCTKCPELKEHIKMHNEAVYGCNVCGKQSDDFLQIQRHKKIHKPSCLCSICGKTFPTPGAMKRHFFKEHTAGERFPCDICNKTYHSISAVKIHQMIHNDVKPFSCSFEGCNYASSQKTDVKTHERTHTNDRPYKCTYFGCNVSFKTSSQKSCHMRRHTGEKRHSCSVCGMKFTERNQLTAHALTHTDIRPHSCDICGKSFRRRYYVRAHKLKKH